MNSARISDFSRPRRTLENQMEKNMDNKLHRLKDSGLYKGLREVRQPQGAS